MSSTDGPALARGPRRFIEDGSLDGWLIQPEAIAAGHAARDLVQAGHARPLAGGPLAFSCVRLHPPAGVAGEPVTVPLTALRPSWRPQAMARLSDARPPFAGMPLDRPRIMGIVNVTPDSFSDGGAHFAADAAVAHGIALRAAGADILDVGGDSTRPGAEPVPVEVRLHDLARDFAGSRLDAADGEPARLRHAGHYRDVLSLAQKFFVQGKEGTMRGLQLFDLERANILAGQSRAENN